MSTKFAVIVPTLNAMVQWPEWQAALARQSMAPAQVVIMDSQSSDGTAAAAAAAGYQVVGIERSMFDAGGTRQQALLHVADDTEFVVYMTQDAILAGGDALRNIISVFEDASIGAAYGRQLPRLVAGPIEAHARLFNYPAAGEVRSYEDRHRLGLKVAFCSNSFAAYRRTALAEVGGFPDMTIFGEDMITAARMLKARWKVSYAADATVYHSHGYKMTEEFRRYFDVGALHAREPWLIGEFGKPEGEGMRYVISELAYVRSRSLGLIPVVFARTFVKYAGYHAGKLEGCIAPGIKMRLSMNKGFWRKSITTSGVNRH